MNDLDSWIILQSRIRPVPIEHSDHFDLSFGMAEEVVDRVLEELLIASRDDNAQHRFMRMI
jgi:hypothetical protein